MKSTFWTAGRDRRLIALQEAGLSGSQIAEKLGTTRNAVIARSNRIRGVKFTSDVERREQLRESARERRAEQKAKEQAAIADMRQMLRLSGDRRDAIIAARKAGATLAAIGATFGVSKQRIHQIVGQPFA